MSIANALFSTSQKPLVDVRINGVRLLDIVAIRGGSSVKLGGNPVPWCDIEVWRDSLPPLTRGMHVTVDLGYEDTDGIELVRKFTGGYFSLDDEDPDFLRTQCFGRGATDEDGVTLEATASVIDHPPIWPPIPSGQFIDFSVDNHLAHTQAKLDEMVLRELGRENRIPNPPTGDPVIAVIHCVGDLKGAFRSYSIPGRDVSGLNVSTAIRDVLSDSGIESMNVYTSAYTLAASGATLDRQPGSLMLQKLMQLDGARVQQLPSGLVIVRVIEEQPAPTARFTYSTTDANYASIVENTNALRVPLNPLVVPGETHELQLGYLNRVGRYFMHTEEWGIDWRVGEGDLAAWSEFQYSGGDEFGGSLGVNPVASFTWAVAIQSYGGEMVATITLTDQSHDSDGSIDQAASTWATNQTTIPDISDFDGERVATIRIALDDIVGDFEITRHVEDNDGLADDHTEIIDVSGGSGVTTPPFYVAAESESMATPDGGENFNDDTLVGTTTQAIGARLANGVDAGHALRGNADGSIDRTLDFGVTWAEVLAAVGSPIMDVVWDWRDQSLAWALTDNGKLYLSNDYGASFFLLADLRTVTYGGFGGTPPAALGNIIGLPAGGGAHVFGGDGAGRPMHVYNANPIAVGNQWLRVTFTGDLLTDTTPVADNSMRITSYAAPGYGGETMAVSFASGGGASITAVYHTNDPIGLSRSFTRATGLPAGAKDGRVVMESGPLSPRHRLVFLGDAGETRHCFVSVDGIAYTEITDALPLGFEANHGLFVSSVLGGLAGVYEHVLAVEDATGTGGVLKSTDEGETWDFLRGPGSLVAWVAGAKAKKVALGAPALTTGDDELAAIGLQTSPRAFSKWNGTSWSAAVGMSAGITGNDYTPYAITEDLIFVVPYEDSDVRDYSGKGVGARSKDGGATWAATPTPPNFGSGGMVKVIRDAGGRIWCLYQNGASDNVTRVAYSDDEGDNWTESVAFSATGKDVEGWELLAHPTNPNVIVVVAVEGFIDTGFVAVTEDRGDNWAKNYPAGTLLRTGARGNSWHAVLLSSGRMLLSSFSGTTLTIFRTDDYGATLTTIQTFSAAGADHRCYGFLGRGNFAAMVIEDDGDGSGTPSVKVYVSNDAGTSFADAGVENLYAFLGNNLPVRNGFCVSPFGDALYVKTDRGGGAQDIVRLKPVSALGQWSALATGYPHTGNDGDYNIGTIPHPLGH